MGAKFYHIDWIRHFDVPLTDHFHVELGRQTIEHEAEDREPRDSMYAFEFGGGLKTKGDHPRLEFNCNNDHKQWFFNIFDKRHREHTEE